MPATETKPALIHWRHFTFAIIVAAVIAAIGGILNWSAANRLLHADARAQAQQWAKFIKLNLEDLDGVLAGKPITANDMIVLKTAREAGDVFRYHIFSVDGWIMFSSDFLGLDEDYQNLIGKERHDLDPRLLRGEVLTELEDGREKPNRPNYYAETYFPVVTASGKSGVIEVYVDQSGKVARYWESFELLIWGFVVMLILAAILPGALIRNQYERLRGAESHIRELAFQDSLTGLQNRRAFQDELDNALNSSATISLLLFDLDGFKAINDSLGHQVGDELLLQIANSVTGILPPGCKLSRIGGDEFAIIAHLDEDETLDLAARIVDLSLTPLEVGSSTIIAGISVGVASAMKSGRDRESILQCADLALYSAKENGRGKYCLFHPSLRECFDAQIKLEAELRNGIGNGEIVAYYQPTFRPGERVPSGAEALLRWQHPEKGILSAGAFLTELTDSVLLSDLSFVALRQACCTRHQFDRQGFRPFPLSVNVSGYQLSKSGFASELCAIVAEYKLQPSDLIIEVTESVILGQYAGRTIRVLENLHEQGFRISLDDFGTGYASFVHLRNMPVDQIKIDRSFVGGVGKSAEDEAIVDAIVRLARALGIEVVAEGVETQEQQRILTQMGCQRLQGFGLAKPMPVSALQALLEQTAAKSDEMVFS